MSKHYLIAIVISATLFISGCFTTNTQLNLNPIMAKAVSETNIPMNKAIQIRVIDTRKTPELAKVNRDGHLVQLTAARNVTYLMQEMLTYQMQDRGYKINYDAPTIVQLSLNQLSAEIDEGTLRHSITANVDITLTTIQYNQATYSKNYHSKVTKEGALGASNANITNALTEVLSNVSAVMANDPAISQFIKNN